ncbi:MAG: hypothetical protein JNN15_00700, partial [Blastocatellia bacterium]|nr:hypothetical protein [Blastocatellia bacterium]
MKKFIVVFLLAIFSTMSLTPTAALAQRRGYYRDTVYYTKADVERVIRRAEDQSDRFQKVLDRALDRSSLDGSNLEDRLNDQAKRLERALDDLRDDFDRAR